MFFILGCGGSIGTGATPVGAIAGRLRTDEGRAVAGAALRAGAIEGVTDADGAFVIEDLEPGVVRMEAEAAGFSPASLSVRVDAGSEVELVLVVRERQAASLADAAAGGRVETAEGLRLDFPPGAFRSASDEPVVGVVDLGYALFDTPLSLAAAPGGLWGRRSSGAPVLLVSDGMVDVEASQAGAEVELVAQTGLSFPAMGNRGDFGAWWYDPLEEAWVEDGVGSVEDGRFEARIDHFSTWNCDAPSEYTEGCVTARLLRGGEPLANSYVHGWLSDGGYQGDTTDADGGLYLYARPGSYITLGIGWDGEGRLDGGSVDLAWSLGPFEVPASGEGCLELGDYEPTGVDLDGDGVGVQPWGGDCYDQDPKRTDACPDAGTLEDTGFGGYSEDTKG